MSHSLCPTCSKHLHQMSMHRPKPLRTNGRCKKVSSRYRQNSRITAYKSIPKRVRYTRVGSFRGGAGRKRARNVQSQAQAQYSALKIISYFSDSDSRQVFDAYYGGTTIVQESDHGPEQHFIWTPLTGKGVCRSQNIKHAKDSYKMECQTATRNLPGFYDSFCMLYSIYNQARHFYTLPELYTTHNEPFLFNHYYQAIANVPNLNIYQQKELLRLLANRNLLVHLFTQMAHDAEFWNCFKAILKFGWPGWTMAKLKIDFPEAIHEFKHYTFDQQGVINELLPQ